MMHEVRNEFPNLDLLVLFGTHDSLLAAAGLLKEEIKTTYEPRKPKVLTLDIECKPIKGYFWGLYDQNISPEMIIEDWSVMSWAAKWSDQDEVLYKDLSKETDHTNDKEIVKSIFDLINSADHIISQNGIKFDIPKLNGKFEEYGLGRPKPFRHSDTFKIAGKLGLTSRKLSFMTDKFNKKYYKMRHEKYPGFSLHKECLAGNQDAWNTMREYNIYDVLSTEELYFKSLIKWDNVINFGVYTGSIRSCPNCGSQNLEENGLVYTKTAANQNFKCLDCGTQCSSRDNLIKKSIRGGLLK